MIYVYTSILNGWDNLRPPVRNAFTGIRYVCFTNVSTLPAVEPWEYRPLYPAGESCRTARVPKILPHLMLPEDAQYSIYLDGNLRLKAHPTNVLALLGVHDWAAHKHPERTCIYQEANVILNHPTMAGWRAQKPERAPRIEAEIARYKLAGHPVQSGLWANGFIVRRHTPEVAALNERWWNLYGDGGERDQLSFPVARLAAGVEVKDIPGSPYDSPYVEWFHHAAWKDQESSREFRTERAGIRERLSRLKALTGSDGGVKYPEY